MPRSFVKRGSVLVWLGISLCMLMLILLATYSYRRLIYILFSFCNLHNVFSRDLFSAVLVLSHCFYRAMHGRELGILRTERIEAGDIELLWSEMSLSYWYSDGLSFDFGWYMACTGGRRGWLRAHSFSRFDVKGYTDSVFDEMYVDTLCGLGFCNIITAGWKPLCASSFSSL